MAQVEVSTDFLTNVANYVKGISEVQGKQAEDGAAAQKEAQATLEILKSANLCDHNATDDQLLEKLGDHAETLRTLGRLAKQVPPPSMGTPGSNKEAGIDGDEDMKESDKVFLTSLGLL